MTTYLVLISMTEAGAKKFKDTGKRADAFVKAAKKAGAGVRELLWTVGRYDGALVLEAPDDATAARLLMDLCAGGFVKTQSLRAFTRDEVDSIVR
jgi:uncharacterized protein with GYD domain